MTGYGYSRPNIPPLSSPLRRFRIFFCILLVHTAVIGGPLLWLWVYGKLFPPKEIAFKVKLGGLTPSHAEVVGEPERKRPAAGAPAAAPPEPVVKPRPRPVEPVVKPKKRPVEPTVKPKPRPKLRPVEPTVKPRPRPKPQANRRRKPVEPTVNPRHVKSVKKTTDRYRRPSSVEEAQRQVYQPSGGSNFNPNVKIGSRDAGQVKGRPDHKTPQGGLTRDEEAYYANLKKFLDVKWVEPSRTHLGELRPKATLELNVAADGRVLGARIIESSGNNSMDESIRRLIKVLDRVPTPPNGALRIYVQMEVK